MYRMGLRAMTIIEMRLHAKADNHLHLQPNRNVSEADNPNILTCTCSNIVKHFPFKVGRKWSMLADKLD